MQATAKSNLPQWSLTSSVRKRVAGVLQFVREIGPAMEPDLIGQEKSSSRALKEYERLEPAMEPDLIGQEKAMSIPSWNSAPYPQWSLTSSVRKRASSS